MILEGDIPDELATWIQQEAAKQGNDIAALNHVVVMYDYLDTDGDSNWNYHVRGDCRINRVIGLMEMVKIRMMTAFIRQGLEEDPEDVQDT
jgi:ABC-type anion transport system duplicated permease subunit